MEEVTFTDSNGNNFVGTLSIPKQAESITIISHGFTSSKKSKLYVELQDKLNKANIGTLRFDFYGHGKLYCKNSKYKVTKDTTLSKAVESLKAAVKFARSQGDYNICLIGSSFGGLISLIVASQDSNINALALKSPVTEPISFWKRRVEEGGLAKWKKEGILHYNEHGEEFELDYAFWEDLNEYDTFKMAENISCPVLLVHGDSDTVVPIAQSKELAKIIGIKIKIIKGANHGYKSLEQYSEMQNLIVDFIQKHCQS